MTDQTIEFKPLTADKYMIVRVDTLAVLKSWKASLFSFEWLTPEGAIRSPDEMPVREREKRLEVEKSLQAGAALDMPILGIGLLDNIEIGSGRAVFLTLASMGHTAIPVAITKANEKDFKKFLA